MAKRIDKGLNQYYKDVDMRHIIIDYKRRMIIDKKHHIFDNMMNRIKMSFRKHFLIKKAKTPIEILNL